MIALALAPLTIACSADAPVMDVLSPQDGTITGASRVQVQRTLANTRIVSKLPGSAGSFHLDFRPK